MRTIFLLPLTALVAIVAGCGSEAREQAARSVPERDLTLVTQTAQVEIASPVETQQLRIPHRTVHSSQRAARPERAPRASRLESQVKLAASTSDNDRELLPGKTVTVIPVSNGPSPGSDRADEFPPAQGRTMVARGGGTCRGRGRGPGIGIATAPRPDFR